MRKKFYRKVLKNGMTLIFEKRDIPVISVAFAVRYGGINEEVNERGIAHFIEHLLYKGTKNRTHKEISEAIEKNGGIMNGFTEETITAFWCKMPSDKLKIALEVLGDMIQNPLFDEKEINKERKVIFEEMKIYHDTPRHYVFDKIQSMLYADPLGTPLIGTEKTLNSITRKKIIEKFNSIYSPRNLILCVVGDANLKELLSFVNKNFPSQKKGIIAKKMPIIKQNKIKIESREGIDQANLILAFHAPLSKDKKVYAAKVLMNIMANGLSSRLFHEIREKRNLAYSVAGDIVCNKHFSYCYVYAGVLKKNIEKVKKIILREFQKISNSLTAEELAKSKEQLIGNYKIASESSDNQMVQLLLSEVDDGVKDFYEFEKKIKAVKLKDVKNIAKIKKYSFFALVPK